MLYEDDSDEAEAALAVLRGKPEVQAEVMAIRDESSKSEVRWWRWRFWEFSIRLSLKSLKQWMKIISQARDH